MSKKIHHCSPNCEPQPGLLAPIVLGPDISLLLNLLFFNLSSSALNPTIYMEANTAERETEYIEMYEIRQSILVLVLHPEYADLHHLFLLLLSAC
jgi:hypothetical protein